MIKDINCKVFLLCFILITQKFIFYCKGGGVNNFQEIFTPHDKKRDGERGGACAWFQKSADSDPELTFGLKTIETQA